MKARMFSMIRNPGRHEGKTKMCFTIGTIHNYAFMENIVQRCEDKIKDSLARRESVLICRWVSSAHADSPVSFGGTGSNATSMTDIVGELFFFWERILPIVI